MDIVCFACNKSVVDGAYVCGNGYHSKCRPCFACNKSVVDGAYVLQDGYHYNCRV